MRETMVDVRGTNVRMLEAGTGPSVLFLHGIDGPSADPLLSELAKSFRVLAPEMPGFALSPIPDWMMNVGDAAYFTMDLIAALGLPQVHLAGHSIGGWIAAEVAIRSTHALASLSLLAPAGVMPREAPGHDVFLLSGDESVRVLFHDQALADQELAARAGDPLDIILQNRAGLARLAWTPRMASVTLPQWLHRIDIPTFIAWGREDRILPFSTHEIFAREIAGAHFLELPGCGHAIPHERGVEMARAMGAFMNGAR